MSEMGMPCPDQHTLMSPSQEPVSLSVMTQLYCCYEALLKSHIGVVQSVCTQHCMYLVACFMPFGCLAPTKAQVILEMLEGRNIVRHVL